MTAEFTDRNPELGALYPDHVAVVSARHDAALDRAGAAHAVIFSGRPRVAFLDDNHYPFRANPHFLGWVPLPNLPLSYIVYTPGEKPRLIYHQPRDYWHAVPGDPEGYWTGEFEICIVHSGDEVASQLPEARDKCVFVGELHDEADGFGIERANPSSVLNYLHYHRGTKTAYEIELMRLASARGVAGHRAAEAAFHAGLPEFAIHQAYCDAVQLTDNELPYDNIVALNEHAAVLHYTALDRATPGDRRSFLIDAGARVLGYASDITRTYADDDSDFTALIRRMDQLQQEVTAGIRAGVDFSDLHIETHRLVAGVLTDAGFARGDSETLIETGVTSAFFPHGLGHLLGIQVHDVGGHMQDEAGGNIDPPSGHPFLRLTRKLETDMVLTVEPGLYAIDLLLEDLRGTPAEAHVDWDRVDWLRPFGGIRIEDNVRILSDGAENLTRDAFRHAAQ